MKKIVYVFLVLSLLLGCDKDEIESESSGDSGSSDGGGTSVGAWSIPKSKVLDGGPGKDGIPAIEYPQFTAARNVGFLEDDDLVLGFADGDEIKAYPHAILDWHEIVNDGTSNFDYSVIYCPLTSTGIAWNRIIDGESTSFGVSGLLYKSNIIPYDRKTNTNWSQLLFEGVNGELQLSRPETFSLVETTWETWKNMYPNSEVLNTNTGNARDYSRYPYGGYKTTELTLFPVDYSNKKYSAKERVLTVFSGSAAKSYHFDSFEPDGSIVNDVFSGMKLVVYASKISNFMFAFSRVLTDGTELTFTVVKNKLPIILMDNEGNKWDVFGRAVSGSRVGDQLVPAEQMMGYWFAFSAFYSELEVYN